MFLQMTAKRMDANVKHDNLNVVAIIPARGGSKGIPRKNVQILAGKPLIAYTIDNALQSCIVNRVIVSTDEPEIAAVSKYFESEVIWRPHEISGDLASSETALLHALNYLQQTEGYEPDITVFLQCTSPLILPEDIDGTIKALLEENADSALAVTPFHYFLWHKDLHGDAVGINHDKLVRLRRQEREPQFMETGSIYVMRTRGFKSAAHRFFGKIAMYVMPVERCLEIDDPPDIAIAEALMWERHTGNKIKALPPHIGAVVFDFDGVFTDNRVIVSDDGHEAVICDRGDGMGISLLKKWGIPTIVLSTEENSVVSVRCKKLGLHFIHGIRGKKEEVLSEWLMKNGIEPAQVVYVGNDVNDIGCLQAVGCGVVARDAHPQAKSFANIILSSPGGRGAVREIIDLVTKSTEREK